MDPADSEAASRPPRVLRASDCYVRGALHIHVYQWTLVVARQILRTSAHRRSVLGVLGTRSGARASMSFIRSGMMWRHGHRIRVFGC